MTPASIRAPRRAAFAAMTVAVLIDTGCAMPPASTIGETRPQIPPSTYWLGDGQATQSSACRAHLAALRARLHERPVTTLLAVRGDQVVFSDGPIDHATQVASIRKSLLAMLYGQPVEDGRIRLDATLDELHVDDIGGLLPIERQARVLDLIESRSGVYHPAANGGDDEDSDPPRGSRRPGTYFLYNNWDFNAAGAIYTQQTGRDIYDAFDSDIARPLGLEDFRRASQHYLGDRTRSEHLAYVFYLSARDMARLGELMLAGGRWRDRQIVPADWVRRITTQVTPPSDMHPERAARRGVGYGMMWWVPQGTSGSPLQDSFLAWGLFGQWILVMPRSGLVVVEKYDVSVPLTAHIPTVPVSTFLQEAAGIAEAGC
jgi:CubicO group peptidase (beta-lactamase class C family)